MTARLLFFWLLVLLPSAVYGQGAFPRHLHVEPVVGLTGITSSDQELAWNDLYGARVGLSLTSRMLVYAGYWPLQPVAPFHFRESRRPTDRVGQWNAGLRLVAPLRATHGVFGSLGVGWGALRSDHDTYPGFDLGGHIEYWIRPSLFLRGGLGVAVVDDHFSYSVQFGAAVVPFRW